MPGSQHRILVYGAGVIGSYYATLLATAGEDVSLLARGRRLEQLRLRRDINVLDRVDDSELFDFIFVAVRSNQMISALDALRSNVSGTIVTLANSDGDYSGWEEAVGKGRLLPAFPSAGGSIDSEGGPPCKAYAAVNTAYGLRGDRRQPDGALVAEGRVSQWSCHKCSSEGRPVPRRTEPKRVSGTLAQRTGFDRFFLERARSVRRYRPEEHRYCSLNTIV